jgi:hypothetical protein
LVVVFFGFEPSLRNLKAPDLYAGSAWSVATGVLVSLASALNVELIEDSAYRLMLWLGLGTLAILFMSTAALAVLVVKPECRELWGPTFLTGALLSIAVVLACLIHRCRFRSSLHMI